MPSTQTIDDAALRALITKAISGVCDTMLGEAITLVSEAQKIDEIPPALRPDDEFVVGTVGFAGDVNGLIYLHLNAGFASLLTSRLLGLTPDEIASEGDECVNDAVAELTNVSAGSFKNELCDMNLPCRLTVPSILRGRKFSIQTPEDLVRRIYTFSIGQNVLMADLIIKFGD